MEGDGETVFRHTCKLGLEGIVSKRKGLRLTQRLLARLAQVDEPERTRIEMRSRRGLGQRTMVVTTTKIDYAKLSLSELAEGIDETLRTIHQYEQILDRLKAAKTVGLQAAVAAIHDLLPKLEEDLKALKEAYATKQKQTASKGKQT